jgi:PAS domain S-box-containing protein
LRVGEIPAHFENEIITRDGERRMVSFSNTVLFDEAGEPEGVVSLGEDVTVRRRAEQAKRVAEARFRETLENVALIAVGIDVRGILTFANDALLALTGWSRQEVVGHDWFDRFDDNPYVRADYFERMALGDVRPHFQSTIRTRSGDRREISWSSTLQRDESGAVTGISAIGEDVTERRRADALLRSREELFRSLIENASDVITILSADGTSLYESPSVERVLGRTPEEIVGMRSFSLVHPDDVEGVKATFAAIVAGEEPGPTELRLRHLDASWRTVEAIGRRRRQDGEWVVVVNYRDVTDQRLLQEQLMQSQKLEAVGRLAGGVAHDFNNLLTAIGGYSQLLVAAFDDDDPRREDAIEIVRASDRAAALTGQLLAFSSRQVLLTEVLDLDDVAGGLENFLSHVLGNIELSTALEPGCRVRANRGQVEQVITNLVLNARDAMPAGGKVELSVRRVEGEVELSVRDNGVGMDAETITHVLEPFFTTKPAGKGTGLGLATVYGIVTQSGGEIAIASQPGEGSTFRILLPLSAEDTTVAVEREERPVDRAGSEGVLLAEDEDTIRRLVGEVLRRSGYKVFAAPNGDEAIRLLAEHEDEIHLLLTDVVMPGMSGPDLARAASRLKPSLRVLFTSGYADEEFEGTDIDFIGKPFSPQALVAKVREVLDAG